MSVTFHLYAGKVSDVSAPQRTQVETSVQSYSFLVKSFRDNINLNSPHPLKTVPSGDEDALKMTNLFNYWDLNWKAFCCKMPFASTL